MYALNAKEHFIKKRLKNHVTRDHSLIKYYCDQCDHFYSRKELMRHPKDVHTIVRITCPKCNNTYKNKKCLKVWSPHKQGDIDLIERVQRRVTKNIPALKHLPYEEILRRLKLLRCT